MTTTTTAPDDVALVDEITEAGVYDVEPHIYHQDPVRGGSLSSTVARLLVEPGGPARHQHGERRESAAFDFGSLAHLKLLGRGERIRYIDADDYKTKAAREARDEAYAAGQVPVLTGSDWIEKADAMVDAVHRDPTAHSLLTQPGEAEQTVVWQEDGAWCRALVDYLPATHETRRLLAVDYKTARSVAPRDFAKHMLDHGYAEQADFYLRGLRATGWASEESRLLLVVQEKQPPYMPIVVDPLLDHDVARVAKNKNDRALAIWRECRETGVWPGVVHDPGQPLAVPAYWYAQNEEWLA